MDARRFHLELLCTSLASPPTCQLPASSGAPCSAAAATALLHLQQGRYRDALTASLPPCLPPGTAAAPPESVPDWFDALRAAAQEELHSDAGGCTLAAAAVACLYLFTQANLTGPTLELPECPFDLLPGGDPTSPGTGTGTAVQDAHTKAGAAEAAVSPAFGQDSASAGDRWAAAQLAESGEELVGRILYPQYLLLAKMVLVVAAEAAQEEMPAAQWWAMRALLMQQRLLAGRSAVLREALTTLASRVLAAFAPPAPGASEDVLAGIGADLRRALAASALLEAAAVETAYGDVAASKGYLQRSGEALGLQVRLAGALGVRTAHQQDPRAQLIVAVSREVPPPPAASPEPAPGDAVGLAAGVLDAALGGSGALPDEMKGLEDESDVLPHPQLVLPTQSDVGTGYDNGLPVQLPTDLSPLEQAHLLGCCVLVRKGTAPDGLQPWEAGAYADAVLQQRRSEFLVRAAARLQASRSERQRARTRERALLALEGLVEGLEGQGEVAVHQRMRCAFSVWFPLRVVLRRELGESLVALGLVGAALPLFESLELWDSLIVCYQLLDKRVAAEQLIMSRLESSPEDPRLWCALGDLTQDEAHFEAAWERSGHRSARAQRSLARAATKKGAHRQAAAHWEAALALNPMQAEGWYSLGWCWIKEKEYTKAAQALTRAAQMEPDHAATWNNLAAVHLHAGRWREAHAALSEAVRLNRDSWQTWENFSAAAVKVGDWQGATRGLGQVLALSQGERLDLEVLSDVVAEVERQAASVAGGTAGSANASEGTGMQLAGQEPDATAEHSDSAAAAEGVQAPGSEAGEDSGAASLAEALSGLGTSSTADTASTCGGMFKDPALVAAQQQAAQRSTETLCKAVGDVMKQLACASAGGSAFWGLYARYYRAVGQPDAAVECLLKRVRALQGGGWSRSAADFEAYAAAVQALCGAYLNRGGRRELGQARMLLRGAVKQAQERFDEHAAYGRLQQTLKDVECQEQQTKQLEGALA